MTHEFLTIGQAAKQTRVNTETLRYYERRGLLVAHDRRESGYRLYTDEAIKRVRFIKNAQALGFTLDEIAGLLKLRVSRRARCGNIKRKTEIKLGDVQEKIAGLRALEKVLKDLIKACHSRSTTDYCPVLRSLEVQKRDQSVSKGREQP